MRDTILRFLWLLLGTLRFLLRKALAALCCVLLLHIVYALIRLPHWLWRTIEHFLYFRSLRFRFFLFFDYQVYLWALIIFTVVFILLPDYASRPWVWMPALLKWASRKFDDCCRATYQSVKDGRAHLPAFLACLVAGAVCSYLVMRAVTYFSGLASVSAYPGGFPWAVVFTAFTAPFFLLLWHWRQLNRQRELDFTNRQLNEDLLLRAGEQIGSDNGAVRLCGLQALDRYARLMLANPAAPDWGEFQRSLNILCAFARGTYRGMKREVTARADAPTGQGEQAVVIEAKDYPLEYEQALKVIAGLTRDYASELAAAVEADESRGARGELTPPQISLPMVDLSGCGLHGQDFFGCFLRKADLRETDMCNTSFKGAKLIEARFDRASFQNVDCCEAIFDAAILDNASFCRVNFNRASIGDAWLRGAKIEHCSFEGAILSGVKTMDLHCVTSEFESASFRGAELRRSRYTSCGFEKTCMEETDLSGVNFDRSYFLEARFGDAYLYCTSMCGSDFSHAINLAQWQIELSIGDSATKIPSGLRRPDHWGKSEDEQRKAIAQNLERQKQRQRDNGEDDIDDDDDAGVGVEGAECAGDTDDASGEDDVADAAALRRQPETGSSGATAPGSPPAV